MPKKNRRFMVNCREHGISELSYDNYMYQLSRANDGWYCSCGAKAYWVGIEVKCLRCNEWTDKENFFCPSCSCCFFCDGTGVNGHKGVPANTVCPICNGKGANNDSEKRA